MGVSLCCWLPVSAVTPAARTVPLFASRLRGRSPLASPLPWCWSGIFPGSSGRASHPGLRQVVGKMWLLGAGGLGPRFPQPLPARCGPACAPSHQWCRAESLSCFGFGLCCCVSSASSQRKLCAPGPVGFARLHLDSRPRAPVARSGPSITVSCRLFSTEHTCSQALGIRGQAFGGVGYSVYQAFQVVPS